MGGVTIAGASGIFKENDYFKGRFEHQPYNASEVRSIYHTRHFDISKLSFLNRPDIFMSHDWPNGIELYGDAETLLKRKPFFRQEIQTSTLGSPPLQGLLAELRPRFWFSAHLHVRHAARADFTLMEPTRAMESTSKTLTAAEKALSVQNPEALDIDDDFQDDERNRFPPVSTPHISREPIITEFLSLGKYVPNGDYLHFFDLDAPCDPVLQKTSLRNRPEVPLSFNLRWLAITRAFHPYFSLQRQQKKLPSLNDDSFRSQIFKEQQLLEKRFEGRDDPMSIRQIQEFVPTASMQNNSHKATQPCKWKLTLTPAPVFSNQQTERFCEHIGISNRINTGRETVSYNQAGGTQRQIFEKNLGLSNSSQGKSESTTKIELAKIREVAEQRKRKRFDTK